MLSWSRLFVFTATLLLSLSSSEANRKKELEDLLQKCEQRENQCTSTKTTLDEEVASSQAARQELEASVANLEKKVTALEATSQEKDSTIRNLEAKLGEATASSGSEDAALRESVSSLEARIQTLQKELEETHNRAGQEGEKAGQLERKLKDVEQQTVEAVEKTKREIQADLGRKLELTENEKKEIAAQKDKLHAELKTVVTQVDTTKTEIVELRRSLHSANERVVVLEKEKNYYWELLDEFREWVQERWAEIGAFAEKQYEKESVQDVVKPIEKALGPYMKQAVVATMPMRLATIAFVGAALAATHMWCNEHFCNGTQTLADFAKLQEVHHVILSITNKLNKHCEGVLIFCECVIVYYILKFVWSLIFGKRKKKKKTVTSVKKNGMKKKHKTH